MADEFESTLTGLSTTRSYNTSAITHSESELETSGAELNVTRDELERRQLLHTVQLLRLEISQKCLLIENLKTEQSSRIDELKEQLADATHAKQLLQLKLENAIRTHRTDSRRLQEKTQIEIAALKEKQSELERKRVEGLERGADFRGRVWVLTEEEYDELSRKEQSALSLSEELQLHVYSLCAPLRVECMQLRDRLEQTDAQMKERERELDNSCRELNEKAFALSEVQRECERYQTNVVHLESQIREADYKQTNFDRVKSERDQLERECAHLRHSESLIEASLTNCQKDRDSAQHELLARQQTLALLTQDKEYLTRQVQDLTGRCHHAEERADSLNGQLLESKKAREDLYEKFVVSREQSKSEYERKLSDEIQKLRSQTAVELDQVRTSLKDMYERENRSLHEARDLAVSEKENAVQSLHESQAKVEQLSLQMRHLQLQLDSKTGELHSDLRLKSFETEKAQMLLEEQSINLKKLCMENDKLKEKLEVLTREFYTLQSSSDKHIAELENECCQRAEKLGSYEKVERELDEVVMQAAEVSDNGEAERVLFSYGYGANVPSTAKRRLQQSVHLAQRVLQLERDNTSLRQEVEQGQDDYKQLQDELAESRQHLDESRQPYSYLIESMKSRDEQIKVQRLKMESLENEVRRLNAERSELVRSKNLMSADLERLLSQREEMAVMRQLLGGLHNQRSYPSRTTDVHGASSTAVHMPPPTVLSRRDPPDWYRRLKQMSAPVKLKGRPLGH